MIYIRPEYVEETLFRIASKYCTKWNDATKLAHRKDILTCVYIDPTYAGGDKIGEYAAWTVYTYHTQADHLEKNFFDRCAEAFKFCEANSNNLLITVKGVKLEGGTYSFGNHETYYYMSSSYQSIYDVEKALNDPKSYYDVGKIVQLSNTKEKEPEGEKEELAKEISSVQEPPKQEATEVNTSGTGYSRYGGLMQGVNLNNSRGREDE